MNSSFSIERFRIRTPCATLPVCQLRATLPVCPLCATLPVCPLCATHPVCPLRATLSVCPLRATLPVCWLRHCPTLPSVLVTREYFITPTPFLQVVNCILRLSPRLISSTDFVNFDKSYSLSLYRKRRNDRISNSFIQNVFFLSDFSKNLNSQQTLVQIPNTKFHENPAGTISDFVCRQTDMRLEASNRYSLSERT